MIMSKRGRFTLYEIINNILYISRFVNNPLKEFIDGKMLVL